MRLDMKLTAGGRRLAVAALVQSVGIGLFMASSMAFYTLKIGLSANQVALGLATAGAVALGISLLGGVLADRYGARRVVAAVYLGRAVCFGAYAFVRTFWEFLVVTLFAVACDRAGPPVLQALVAAAVPEPHERTRLLAVINAVRNFGTGLGAMAAGVALTTNTMLAYRVTLSGIAVAFIGGAVLVLRVPEEAPAEPVPPQPGERRSALPDRRYLVLTGLNFLLSFFDGLLLVAMPVWVLQHTDAPRATVSALFASNTVLVLLLQIPVSRFAVGRRRTARMVTYGGGVMAVSSLFFATAGGTVGWYAVGWLFAAVVALSLGEVVINSAVWDLSISLAPPAVRGRYLSFFNLGMAGQRVLGPIVITGLLLGSGTVGWVGAAVVFVLAGVATERVALGAGSRTATLVDA
ncbi:MFS transporter [Streptantibioticus silvisoli]|uniref:MFS transporter n=1 Tax=Streptantibioticus silvisoli TaxID=2705255 RepID=A0ABT6W789_9ACTN|nr:MFS transporter [Streptantibioticus silvisoli]MDI5966534.1 MFS transporter [Streptantibioticus silvisoli]